MSTEAEQFVAGLPDGDGSGCVPRTARKTAMSIAALMCEAPHEPQRHRVCWASQTTIGRRIGCSERTVRDHVVALERNLIITRTRAGRPTTGRAGTSDQIRFVGFSDQPAMAAGRNDGPTGNGCTSYRQFSPVLPAATAANHQRNQIRPESDQEPSNVFSGDDERVLETVHWSQNGKNRLDQSRVALWWITLKRQVGEAAAFAAFEASLPKIEAGTVRDPMAYITKAARGLAAPRANGCQQPPPRIRMPRAARFRVV